MCKWHQFDTLIYWLQELWVQVQMLQHILHSRPISDRIINRLIIVAKVWMNSIIIQEFKKLLYAAGKGVFAIASTYLFVILKRVLTYLGLQ